METTAAKDLQKFNVAAEKNDRKEVNNLIKSQLLPVIQEAQKNNEKVVPKIGDIIGKINSLAKDAADNWFKEQGLKAFVWLLNGNRDNLSYYKTDAGREWIQRRLAASKDQLKKDLTDLQKKIVEGRDNLDALAQSFVKGVKEIKELTTNGESAKKNESKIKKTAEDMKKSFDEKSGPLKKQYEDMVAKINALTK